MNWMNNLKKKIIYNEQQTILILNLNIIVFQIGLGNYAQNIAAGHRI